MIGYSVQAKDGELGRVDEFLFDDKIWTIRYLVVETDLPLVTRLVLISPLAIRELNGDQKVFSTGLALERVCNSPAIDLKHPVTREIETELFRYYQWPIYWGDGFLDGSMSGTSPHAPPAAPENGSPEPAPAAAPPPLQSPAAPASSLNTGNSRLQDTHTVMGVHAADGPIGHVEDYIVNTTTWAVNFLVVNTATWLPGKKVLISPQLINHIDLDKVAFYVDMMREVVAGSQEFDPAKLINVVYEAHLYDYYGRPQLEKKHKTKLFGF
jgi:hypothetical protein